MLNKMNGKKTQGRKKIDIKLIEDMSTRHVTFSKRRGGAFSKASELCVLTGAEVAIMVESPGGKLYTFGEPSVDAVVDRYLTGKSRSEMQPIISHHPPPPMQNQVKDKEEVEEKNNNGVFWWEQSINLLGLEELGEYIGALDELKKKVNTRADELNTMRANCFPKLDRKLIESSGEGFFSL